MIALNEDTQQILSRLNDEDEEIESSSQQVSDSDSDDSEPENAQQRLIPQQQRQGRRQQRRQHGQGMRRSYSAESVVSTQSAPPPYELYPPARSFLGRAYNWLRKIPRFATHQAIALPILPVHRRPFSRANSTSTFTADSVASSEYGSNCCSYYYRYVYDRLPTCPRLTLPPRVARFRGVMLCISFFALFLFSFLLFCAIFFSPASLPSPTVPDKTTDSHARLLTLNIFMRPPGVKNNWSDYKDDRLEYIMDYILPEYDIIAFQEAFAFASRRKDRLIRRARELGFNYHVESPRHYPWELAVDGGLLLISRFPIRQSDTIEFPRGTHSDWLAIKGALHALIELNPSRSLHVYTTHTQASYDLFNVINQGDTEIRLSQFARLHQFMSDTAGNDGFPVMVMGDLNVDAATHGEGIAITQPSKESSREYRMLMDVLRGTGIHGLTEKGDMSTAVFEHPWKLDLTDVIYDHYGYHPVTFGDYEMDDRGNLRPAETVLTDSDQLMTVQNIDRMLWAGRSTPVQIVDPKVEKFMVKDNLNMDEERRARTAFTQISDHYGLSCVMQLNP